MLDQSRYCIRDVEEPENYRSKGEKDATPLAPIQHVPPHTQVMTACKQCDKPVSDNLGYVPAATSRSAMQHLGSRSQPYLLPPFLFPCAVFPSSFPPHHVVRCGRCRMPYCSQQCQAAHWPEHKRLCKAIARGKAAADPHPSPDSIGSSCVCLVYFKMLAAGYS